MDMKYDFMQQLFGLLLAKDSLKLLAYIVQSSGMLPSNEDGHGNQSCGSMRDKFGQVKCCHSDYAGIWSCPFIPFP